MSNFFEELKRRRVFRVATSYAVVAFIIMQLVEILFPMFNFPQWTQQFIVIVVLLGFPVAVVLSWIFDKTPQGFIKTDTVSPTTQVGKMTVKVDSRPFYTKKRNIFLVFGVAGGFMIGQINLFGSSEKLVNFTGDRIPIAVADFENNTDDATLDGLSGLLITSLEQSSYLSVVTRSRMFDLLKQIGKSNVSTVDEKLGREICQRADINALVLASIRQFGDLYSVDLKILDIDKDEYLYTTNVQSKGKMNIPGLIDKISKQTRISLAEKAEEIEKTQRDIASLTTKNLEAYKYYDLGEKAMYSFNFDMAEENYLKAIEIDSTFALAHFKLGYAYQWNFNSTKDEYIANAIKYIESVPEKERLYVRAHSINSFLSRIPIFEEILSKYPNEKLAYFEIGDAYIHNGHSDQSIPFFEKSHELDPSFEFAIDHLSWAYIDAREYEKNIALAAQSISIYPDNPKYIRNVLNSYLSAGRFEEYFGRVRAIENSEVQLINTDLAFGNGYFTSGDYDKAKEKYEKVKLTKETELTAIRRLRNISIIRGDFHQFLNYSDEALNYLVRNSDFRQYAGELITRSFTILQTFNDFNKSKTIINDIEKIFEDQTKNVSFNDLRVTGKSRLINIYRRLGDWDKAMALSNESFGQIEVITKTNRAMQFQQGEKYQDAINMYEELLAGAISPDQYIFNFNLGLCYFEIGDYRSSVKYFDEMKDYYFFSYGYRKYYYPKLFLYSGLANYELKNYRLAGSNIETFLKIWAPAPESLKEKKMARETLEKINKVLS